MFDSLLAVAVCAVAPIPESSETSFMANLSSRMANHHFVFGHNMPDLGHFWPYPSVSLGGGLLRELSRLQRADQRRGSGHDA